MGALVIELLYELVFIRTVYWYWYPVKYLMWFIIGHDLFALHIIQVCEDSCPLMLFHFWWQIIAVKAQCNVYHAKGKHKGCSGIYLTTLVLSLLMYSLRHFCYQIGEARALYNLGNVYHAKGKHTGRSGNQDPGEFPMEVKECLVKAAEYYE